MFGKARIHAAALLGREGERRAEAYLKTNGLKRLARNFRCKTGEIDLVMQDVDGTVVFVEVKTRRSEDFTAAEQVVAWAKQQRLRRAARYFLASYPLAQERPLRFDVVVVMAGDSGEIRHYPSAFR